MADFEERLRTFLAHYDELERNQETEDGFIKEFMTLKQQSQQYREQNTYPADAGQLPANKKKNRFKDILPFEYTRVSLHPVEGVDGSDYINANYIADSKDELKYIAAQGPLPNTVNDFWRMLWYHNIEVVIMACRLVEAAKPKCECYWPELNKTKMFGVIQVTTTYEEAVSNDFTIRDILAECEGEQQHIRQYHYTAWPDHGKPSSAEPIIRMIEMLEDYRKRLDVPIVVHCSAGCGRTGTILGIDIARSMLLSKTIPEDFSVYHIVEKMRQQRPAMVQAKDQYLFVYLAVVELVRRTLGNKPQPPPKPDSGRSMFAPSSVSEAKSTEDEHKHVIYENTDSMKAHLPPTNKGLVGGPTAPPRTNATYENVPQIQNGKQPLSPPHQSKKPSPPAKPCSPVAKRRTTDKEKEQKQDGAASSASKPSAAPPSVKPKPRTKQPEPPAPSPPNRPVSPLHKSNYPPRSASPHHPPVQTSTPVKEDKEALYSTVDTTQFRDKGPTITVMDETSGKVAPLNKFEKELEKNETLLSSANTSKTSILDTIMSIVGDIPEDEPDKGHAHLPPPPPPKPELDLSDEIPPMIPRRTAASRELVDEQPKVDIPTGGPPQPTKNGDVSSGVYETPTVSSGVYESPTPFSMPVVKTETSKATAFGSSLGSSLAPTRPSGSGSAHSSLATIPRSSPAQHLTPSPHHPHQRSVRGNILGFLRKKDKDKKKVTTADITGPVGGMVKSASDQDMRPNHPTVAIGRKASSELTNDKYKFPGDLGFGIHISKPRGPRPEPPQWKPIPNNIL